MSANKKSSVVLLCLSLAVACLLGVFAIMDASFANASQGVVPPPAVVQQPSIYFYPEELQATLPPGEVLTQTLWITNSVDSDITINIYEMTSLLPLSGETHSPATLVSLVEPVSVPLIDPDLQAQIDSQGQAFAIITLRMKPDISQAASIPDRAARARYVYDRLVDAASHSQGLFEWLETEGAQPARLLTANAIAATLNRTQLIKVAQDPLVKQIRAEHQLIIIPNNPSLMQGPVFPSVEPGEVEWNIAMIRADQAWDMLGVTGEGAVVGVVDTGVMYDHPALVNSYRGNLGGGNFDHNHNWFDFVNGSPVPVDNDGHGTMITGIVTGDDGGINQIGVAPGANWIADKACEDGMCSEADLHAALQWMLAPTDLEGNNPDPAKAPQVVLGGWGYSTGCNDIFEPDMILLRNAGILPIFATGGNGPSCFTMGSPADLPQVVATGATNENDLISVFSSRGPSCYGEIKPDVSAPGENIRSSFNDGDYTIWSGMAESSAHSAGVAALVVSVDPELGPDAIEDILTSTALCINDQQCSPGATCPDPNNTYGYGRLDAYAAVYAVHGNPQPGELAWLSEDPTVATLSPGEGIAIDIIYDSNGLDTGIYTGFLGISSDDPILPFASVPVAMEVTGETAPAIVVDPLSLSATLPVDGMQTEALTITNDGGSDLTFVLSEFSPTLRLASQPAGARPVLPSLFNISAAAQADAGVLTQLHASGSSRLIIYLGGQPDLSAAYGIADRAARVQYVYDQLLKAADQSADLYDWLLSRATQPHRLLLANAIAATLNEAQLQQVLTFAQVIRVGINASIQVEELDPDFLHDWLSRANAPGVVEWNIAKIGADQVWDTFGIRGEGAVVGIIDTGVDYTHPALNIQYRGNLGGGDYDHNYNWFDLVNGQPEPYDDHGHGTFGMGLAVGDDGGDNQIGVAPGAKWMAVKAIDAGGGGTIEDFQAALEWMLAPTDLNGQNPQPALAPQVVLNMWGMGYCGHDFDIAIGNLVDANIQPVFAPGGEGPGCNTVASPAANPEVLSAGATDSNDDISGFSAKGPSCYDGSIKPDVVAPGVNIRSSVPGDTYEVWSGTSFSTAHLAGAIALLFSADPDLSLLELEQALFDTSVCHATNVHCTGDGLCPEPNNTYGYGRIDVFAAVSLLIGQSSDIPWLSETPISGTIAAGDSVNVSVTFDATGLVEGTTYVGELHIDSNDPDVPRVVVPVTLTVTALCEPVDITEVGFTPSNPEAGEVITFTAVATGSLPIEYSWDFDDGGSGSGEVVTHTYAVDGNYQVVVTAANGCGDPAQAPLEVQVVTESAIKPVLLPIVRK